LYIPLVFADTKTTLEVETGRLQVLDRRILDQEVF
jgi:hypothetical protein